MHKLFLLLLTLPFIVLTACSPESSEANIETAIAETQAAAPTATLKLTDTPEPSSTPKPTITLTPEPTPTTDYTEALSMYREQWDEINDELSVLIVSLSRLINDMREDVSLLLNEDWLETAGATSEGISAAISKLITLEAPPSIDALHTEFAEAAKLCEESAAEISDAAARRDSVAAAEAIAAFADCADSYGEAHRSLEEALEEYAPSSDASEPTELPDPTDTPEQPEQPAVAEAEVVGSNYAENRFGHLYIIGVVENTGNTTIDNIDIQIAIHDGQGETLELTSRRTNISPLAPGQKSPFEAKFTEPPDGWADYDLSIVFSDASTDLYWDIEFVNLSDRTTENSGFEIAGDVVNAGDEDVKQVSIYAAIFDDEDTVIGVTGVGTCSIQSESDILAADASAPFLCNDFNKRYDVDVQAIAHYELFVSAQPAE